MFNRKTVGDQRFHVDLAFRQELKKRFHVSRLGPTHVADRIIAPVLLKRCIVTARSVGTRNPEIQLFFKVELALDVHAYCADRNYNATIAGYFPAKSTGSLLVVSAVIRTASTPYPFECCRH